MEPAFSWPWQEEASTEFHPKPKLHVFMYFFPLVLRPNSGLGRLHETFRFTSVTRSRTVGSTPWTGDELVARTLPVQTQKNAHTTQTVNINVQSGIRTHGPGVRASEDSSCLRPLGYRDRGFYVIADEIFVPQGSDHEE
jgi:hypothetical protein